MYRENELWKIVMKIKKKQTDPNEGIEPKEFI